LWGKALAKSRGNENEALALYMQLRVQSLRDESVVAGAIIEELHTEQQLDDRQAEFVAVEERKDAEREAKPDDEKEIREPLAEEEREALTDEEKRRYWAGKDEQKAAFWAGEVRRKEKLEKKHRDLSQPQTAVDADFVEHDRQGSLHVEDEKLSKEKAAQLQEAISKTKAYKQSDGIAVWLKVVMIFLSVFCISLIAENVNHQNDSSREGAATKTCPDGSPVSGNNCNDKEEVSTQKFGDGTLVLIGNVEGRWFVVREAWCEGEYSQYYSDPNLQECHYRLSSIKYPSKYLIIAEHRLSKVKNK